MKVVISRSVGVFSLSPAAIEQIVSKKGNVATLHDAQMRSATDARRRNQRPVKISDNLTLNRDDPDLVSVVEELGVRANGPNAELVVVTIPEDPEWAISDVAGIEHISAARKVWPIIEGDNRNKDV